MDLEVTTLAARPELGELLYDFPDAWPEFMDHDPESLLYYNLVKTHYAEFVVLVVDRDRPERLAAKGFTVPFTWDRDELPDAGWDEVIRRSAYDLMLGRRGDKISALEACVQKDLRGTGLSRVVLDAMRHNAGRLGFDRLLAPVRPSGKAELPDVPMADYAYRVREDGLPVDPWLRVHVRAGGRIVGVAPRSMTFGGSLAEWREWTGLPFDRTGPVRVPGALTPVLCEVEHGHAVYVEPNVWVEHTTA
ncbi:N-acetyltransferase [Actinokineospora soli]|uniref:N-acetyltransferase n=1 Tax=Actinokineospora soli TaxID=1048753 RepID=A0ABW2TZ37_9PSEU